MTTANRQQGIVANRLDAKTLDAHFSDLHPPLDPHEARVAADRCYFCHDAPCITACPTAIDIPLFIRQIVTNTPKAAAETILSQNILGGMCARVCPTETLCESVCVRETAEGTPVAIGRLQRFATDTLMAANEHPFERAAPTGRRVAVVGAGPAGLSCAHRLAMLGHEVVIYDARAKGGGLNEYGIAAYKSTGGFAQRELDWLMQIGGITLRTGQRLGTDLALTDLQSGYDAIFLGVGLSGVNSLRLDGEDLANCQDAVEFIATLRQASDLATVPIGRRVVVIGGGMTAIDAAVQAKLLGAEEVTIVYRRGQQEMAASRYEQDLAQQNGVRLIFDASPVAIKGESAVTEVVFAYTETVDGQLVTTDETFTLAADQLFKAIGQTLGDVPDGLTCSAGKIVVDDTQRTSVAGLWAGGDCTAGGDDLTVTAVAQGRDAAMDIHASLMEAR